MSKKTLGENHARSTDEKDRSQSWKGAHGKFMITLTDTLVKTVDYILIAMRSLFFDKGSVWLFCR